MRSPTEAEVATGCCSFCGRRPIVIISGCRGAPFEIAACISHGWRIVQAAALL